MRKICTLLFAVLVAALTASAQQIVTTSPSLLQASSTNVVLTYHAELGNQGLKGLGSSAQVYAHIGLITSQSVSDSDWKYAPTWGDNAAKYKFSYAGVNTWTLNIGNLRSYFGVPSNVEIYKIALVVRATSGEEGKTASGGDIFINVMPEGFAMEFTSNAPVALNSSTATVNFKAVTTKAATITIKMGTQTLASKTSATELTVSHTFSPGDSKQVVATAVADGETLSQTIDIVYPKPSTPAPYPGGTPKMGTVDNGNGLLTFCLAAPGKESVMLVPSWADYEARQENQMYYQDYNGIRYFWITSQIPNYNPDTEYPYYFLVDGVTGVGDPYARLVLDPYSDKWISSTVYPNLPAYPVSKVDGNVVLASYKGNRDKYNWKVTNFKGVAEKDLIIYEMLIRDFTGTPGLNQYGEGFGDGTLKKAMEKIDYLLALGVNAIELMPIQEFNGNNSWGYNTNFYFAPDKAYGTPDDYRAFIDLCHQNGIAVILDVVFNQSDGLHPWYQMYPTNNNPFYNLPSAPHAYSVLNDWKQDNGLVQQQWTDMLTYWMTAYKVDGFRFDLVKGLGDNSSYPNNSDGATNNYNQSRVSRMKRLTEVVKSINPNAYSINENLAGAQEENEMAANGSLNWANINHQSGQFAMGYESDASLNRFYAPYDSRTWGSTISYAESHDEQRLAYLQNTSGAAGIKGNLAKSMQRLSSVAAQMILAPGGHMIWQFGELGNDTNTKDSGGGNNTSPKPVCWDYLDDPDRKALYDNYCELIHLRNGNPEIFAQDATVTINCDKWSGGRTILASKGDKELILAVNPTTVRASVKATFQKKTAPNKNDYTIMSQSKDANTAFNNTTGNITLDPGCYAVIGRNVSSGINDVNIDNEGADNAINFYVDNGTVYATGTDAKVRVYDLTGAEHINASLAAGIYVVKAGAKAAKIVVD